jgi:hypothetical protein
MCYGLHENNPTFARYFTADGRMVYFSTATIRQLLKVFIKEITIRKGKRKGRKTVKNNETKRNYFAEFRRTLPNNYRIFGVTFFFYRQNCFALEDGRVCLHNAIPAFAWRG